jgi:hypothetical protein
MENVNKGVARRGRAVRSPGGSRVQGDEEMRQIEYFERKNPISCPQTILIYSAKQKAVQYIT